MEPSFLQRYLEAFHHIQGWYSYDAALLFMAYHQLLERHTSAANVLEIGVHHGLSAIAMASLRGPRGRLVAVDLFESLQDRNISRSGEGVLSLFRRNFESFYPGAQFLEVLVRPSTELRPRDLGSGFTFCHIDGGHSRMETRSDLGLCHAISVAGGLLAVDDYFNPLYPGVCEGAVEFMLKRRGALRPLAIGYNKVLFQKTPAKTDLNAEFAEAFPQVEADAVNMWDQRVLLFGKPLRQYFDLHASTPQRLVPLGRAGARAILQPHSSRFVAGCGERIRLPVTVRNASAEAFPSGEKVFGLSYHLLSASDRLLVHDNDRTWLTDPLAPGAEATIDLGVRAPTEPGPYRIEIDLVWEGVMWFKDAGNPTAKVDLSVS
jgi:hypothetical protein